MLLLSSCYALSTHQLCPSQDVAQRERQAVVGPQLLRPSPDLVRAHLLNFQVMSRVAEMVPVVVPRGTFQVAIPLLDNW